VWCSDAAHDFDVDSVQAETVREQQTLTEFRELHRH
jgi:hypothetical protein